MNNQNISALSETKDNFQRPKLKKPLGEFPFSNRNEKVHVYVSFKSTVMQLLAANVSSNSFGKNYTKNTFVIMNDWPVGMMRK